MFKKKPNIKSLAPLRSSDRRKVVDQIIRDYSLAPPAATEPANPDDSTATLTAFRNALLPEGAQSARFTTTVGADSKTASGTVYVGQHPGEEQQILWIKLEDKLVPTVYTLWRHPGLVPLLFTPDIVLQKMRGGADLMTPGLARGPPFPKGAKKGAYVAIAAYEKPGVPVVVGECMVDVCDLTEVRGQKGNAVRGVHWDGDEIWAWGGGKDAPEAIDGWDVGGADVAPQLEALNLEEAPATNGEAKPATNGADDIAEHVDRPARTWSTKEIDDAFRAAFLYALHDIGQKNKSEANHGVPFPLPQSQFTSTLILPYLPTFTPEDAAALQIKKTSWKNYPKFIKALDKDVLLRSKVRNGGETVVLDVDFSDQRVQAFEPYRLPKKASGAAPASDAKDASSGDASVGQKLQLVHLLRPKPSLQRVFAVAQSDIHALYLPSEIKMVINRYLEAEDLVRPDRSRITIDPILADALYSAATTAAGADSAAQQALVQGHAARDALLNRAISHACTAFYLVHRGDDQPDRSRAAAGAPPKVRITLETRSGNKTVTRVSGLEPFFVGPQALADELQKVCAGSTSVSQLAGSSPKKPVMEVMVQGPQRDVVIRQLERRGIRGTWVEVVDKTKKKK